MRDEKNAVKWWQLWWVLVLGALGGLTWGCATFRQVATPARVEAVTALGAYYGAQAVIADGRRAELERGLAGLRALLASGKADIPTIVAAINAAGVNIGSPEGSLAVQAGALVFADLWAGSGQAVLDDALAKAALSGVVRGVELALGGGTRDLRLPSGQTDAQAQLIADAHRTRGKPGR